jgi:hypothetical protein
LIGIKVDVLLPVDCAWRRVPGASRRIARSNPMLDVILLAVGLGFFALSVAYAFACYRL